jgi:DNA-binding transcriptional MerR regulator
MPIDIIRILRAAAATGASIETIIAIVEAHQQDEVERRRKNQQDEVEKRAVRRQADAARQRRHRLARQR